MSASHMAEGGDQAASPIPIIPIILIMSAM